MTNREQIKKILSKLKQGYFCQQNCYGCCGDVCVDITCNTVVDNFIKELNNANYRKIQENAVVLTKEEYIDLSRNYVREQTEQVRKETAKKIYEKAKFIVSASNDFGKKFLHLDVLKEIVNNIEYYVKIEELIAKNEIRLKNKKR